MDSNTADKINRLREELAALEAQATKERENTLKSMPAAAGFKSMDELVDALIPYSTWEKRYVASQKKPNGRRGRPAKTDAAPSAKPVSKPSKGKRAKIDDKMRQDIIDQLRDTGKTAKQIAEEFGVSMPTINLIKKAAGLTKSRK